MDLDALYREFVRETAPLVDRAEGELLAIERAAPTGEPTARHWAEVLLALHTVKGNAGMMRNVGAQSLSHAMEDRAKACRAGDPEEQAEAARALLAAIDALRMAVEHNDAASAKVEAATRRLNGDADDSFPPREEATQSLRAPHAVERVSDVRISAEKLDRMMELVGELATGHSRVLAVVRGLLDRLALSDAEAMAGADVVDQLGKTIDAFRAHVTEARLLPMSLVLGRFHRVVRDISVATGKRAALHVDGADTVVDKMIVDVIGEPLVHIVRNAVDHGIEAPEVRAARGKPAEGRIHISVAPRSSELLLTVKDDGGGIPRGRLADKARELGIDVDAMSDEELLEMIFLPDLSTAEKVTELSGRGVGLDAAKRAIERVGGSIQVTSRPNEGTEFRIRVPMNVTIQKSLVVGCCDEMFAIALSGVMATVRITQADLHVIDRRVYIRFRGKTIPVYDLGVLLGVPGAQPMTATLCLVVEEGERYCGLLVDTVGAAQEIVLKEIDGALGRPVGIAGAAVLGDGRIVMVIDARALGASQRATTGYAARQFERMDRA